jgi:prepilin-type N-terminal cleavage/methylation domain-containing protein
MRWVRGAVPPGSRRLRSRCAEQRGYTLIELLVVMALSTVVVGVPLAFVILSLKQQNVAASRSAGVEAESVGLNRLTRDLRQIAPNTTSTFTWGGTSATASMTLPVPGSDGATTETVVWSCTGLGSSGTGTCTRTVNGGTAVQEITDVVNLTFAPVSAAGSSLTSTASNPSYVGITLQVLPANQLDPTATNPNDGIVNPIILEDGVALRNNA